MEEKHRDLLTVSISFLVENLDMPKLLDHLLETRVLTNTLKQEVEVSLSQFYLTLALVSKYSRLNRVHFICPFQ